MSPGIDRDAFTVGQFHQGGQFLHVLRLDDDIRQISAKGSVIRITESIAFAGQHTPGFDDVADFVQLSFVQGGHMLTSVFPRRTSVYSPYKLIFFSAFRKWMAQ